MDSELKPAIFGLPDLPEWEGSALLIRPSGLKMITDPYWLAATILCSHWSGGPLICCLHKEVERFLLYEVAYHRLIEIMRNIVQVIIIAFSSSYNNCFS